MTEAASLDDPELVMDIFTRLRGRGRLSEKQVDEVLREIRLALLEADVSLRVVKAFVKDVRERAAGAEIHKSLTPAQQVIKLVNEALVDMLGRIEPRLLLRLECDIGPRLMRMAREQNSFGYTKARVVLRELFRIDHGPAARAAIAALKVPTELPTNRETPAGSAS